MANLTQQQENAVQAAFNEAIRLGLTAEQATEAVAEWAEDTNFGESSVDYSNLPGRSRSDRPSSQIGEMVGRVIADRNPGMVAQISSGQEPPLGLANLTAGQRREHRGYMAQGFDSETASRIVNREGARYRHPLGVAVDTEARDIAGNVVKDRDVTDQHAFSFVQATGGNVGRGGFVRMRRDGRPLYYMNAGRNHYDVAPLRSPHMNQFWGSLDEGFLEEMEQANALYGLGLTDQSMLPTPTPRGMPRNWGFETEHPADAMGFPTEAPKSAIPPAPAPPPDGFYESAHSQNATGISDVAPKSALAQPRNDYPVQSGTSTPPQSRFSKGFTRSVHANPQSPSLTHDGIRSSVQPSMDGRLTDSLGRSVAQPAPKSALSDTRLADSLGVSAGPAPISAIGSIPTPTMRPTQSTAPKSAVLDIPVPTARPAQTGVPQSAIQSPVAAGREASRQSVQSTATQPPISALDNPMTGYDPHDGKPAPRSTVGQKFGVPAGRAIGAVAGAALAGPLGAVVGNVIGKSIAQNRTSKGRFPAAPFAPANTFPAAPAPPSNLHFNGGPGSDGLSDYGRSVVSQSPQAAAAVSSGRPGLY